MKTNEMYQQVTDQIIQLIKEHQLNWNKPWIRKSNDGLFAYNANSKKPYRGINQLLLAIAAQEYDYERNAWMTFKQLQSIGAKLNKGSKGQGIYFYKSMYRSEKKLPVPYEELNNWSYSQLKEAGIERIPMLKKYVVFNLSQMTELPEAMDFYVETDAISEVVLNEQAEALLKSTDVNIVMHRKNKDSFT